MAMLDDERSNIQNEAEQIEGRALFVIIASRSNSTGINLHKFTNF